jgi:DNA-binding CsgD family transcriptional regulator
LSIPCFPPQGLALGRGRNGSPRRTAATTHSLFIAESTVKTHMKRLLMKLGAKNRAHAVALGVQSELLALAA